MYMTAPASPSTKWRALLAVVDEGSYAQAAKALHKSQSSVTYAVQKLESLLGVKAFKIQGRKASLTPTGELLYRAPLPARRGDGPGAGGQETLSRVEAEIRVAVETIFPTWLLLGCLTRLGRRARTRASS